MRRYAALVLGAGALIVVAAVGTAAAAGGEAPVTVKLQTPVLGLNVGFSPTALPKREGTPITLRVSSEVEDFDFGHPPALRELSMEFDKAVEIHTNGIPSCQRSELGETVETAAALKRCRPALIGEGEATVQVAYPETEAVNVQSRLLVFKGGERDGKTTLVIYGYFSNPISAAMVTRVTIAKHPEGRLGTRAVAKIPKIAGGAGSIAKFNLEIFRQVEVEGKRYNPISAVCADGALRVHALGEFEDGERVETEVIPACKTRG